MKSYFSYIAGTAARWIRGLLGFVIMGVGYSLWQYPANVVIIIVGAIVALFALFNISLLAPLFGYSIMGDRHVARFGEINGVPGEDKSGMTPVSKEAQTIKDRPGSTATRVPGSTTQGGCNYGQGSMQLGNDANRQGSTKSVGSNYGNEQGFHAN